MHADDLPGGAEKRARTQPGDAALRTVFSVASDQELGLFGARTAGPAPAPPVPDGLERIRGSLSRTVSDGALTASAVGELEQSVLRYGLAARERPAGLLLGDLADDLAELQALMDRPRPLSTTLGLTRVAAQMCGLMCLTLIKLDRRSEFRKWARLARTTAQETSDPATIAWVLAQEAYGHYYAGDLSEALAVARAARDAAAGVPRVGAVLAAALEARVLAARGDRTGCRQALGLAEAGLQALPPGQVGESAFGYDEGQLRFHEGNAYTHLGEAAAAWSAQQRALELCGPADFMDRAFTRLDRASCLIGDGELEAGLAYALGSVSTLTDQQGAGIITVRAKALVDALPATERRALPAAAELRERLQTPDEVNPQ